MATAQSALKGTGPQSGGGEQAAAANDAAESILKTVDESTKGTTGVSLIHMLTRRAPEAGSRLF